MSSYSRSHSSSPQLPPRDRGNNRNDLSLPPISQLLHDVATSEHRDSVMPASAYMNQTPNAMHNHASSSTPRPYGNKFNSGLSYANARRLDSSAEFEPRFSQSTSSGYSLPRPSSASSSYAGSSRAGMPTILNPVRMPPATYTYSDNYRSSLTAQPHHHLDPPSSGHEYSVYPPFTPGIDQRSPSTITVPSARNRNLLPDIDSDPHWQEQTHETLSKGKLNYVCDYCGKAFLRPSALKTHIISHTGDQEYACTEEGCTRRFGVRSNMLRHVRLVHRNLRYSSGEQLSQEEWETGDTNSRQSS
ncbi:hypothetical protein F5878DRAFT_167574 [Lentinula raphanica]|uniref:C2H2-type domain-containing protein n=1 Tax=Lentinula raphanica TaxID=153919 RepID=A0AA38P8Y4_9AGAR|nr:hypothetical protein F5878DRAFT_167574 [Lentinula raphanica]